MGNWHCVPSSCATVEYREYLPSMVRWRYGAEPWQEIEGDNYSVELTEDYSANTTYKLVYRVITSLVPEPTWGNELITNTAWNFNGIDSWRLKVTYKGSTFYPTNNSFHTYIYKDNKWQVPIPADRHANFVIEVVSRGVTSLVFGTTSQSLLAVRFEPINPSLRKTQCVFKVFRNGAVVHQETKSTCPEVQKIPCKLSDEIKQIEIDKFPYLERVEVIPWAYQNFGLNVYRANIPPYCLNIYNNTSATIIPLPGGIPTPSNTSDNNYKFLTQICSSPDCLPLWQPVNIIDYLAVA